jgi:hypothetical protein
MHVDMYKHDATPAVKNFISQLSHYITEMLVTMDTAKIPKDHPMYDTGIVNIANEEHLIAILDDAPPVHAKDNGLAESAFFQ